MVVLVALCAVVPRSQAQPGRVDEAATRHSVHAVYSLDGIPVFFGKADRPYSEKIRPRVLQPFRPYRRVKSDEPVPTLAWHLATPNGVMDALEAQPLISRIARAVDPAGECTASIVGRRVQVAGTAEHLADFEWVLARLRDYYARRIRFSVLELHDPATSGPISRQDAEQLRRKAFPLATRSVPPREVAIISAAKSFDYTADYEVNVATSGMVHTPVMAELHLGRELALSAMPAGGGELYVRAASAQKRLREMWAFRGYTRAGVLEQPVCDLYVQEGVCRLKPGEAWVFGV